MGCAVFHEEEEAEEDLQTGIEVGAECVETRREGSVATGASPTSLSSECSLHSAACSFSSSLPHSPALFYLDASKKG
jgi:hypothetical protein